MKRITTGIENFKEFIDGEYYYVDKSEFICTALGDKVTLFTRPRRFGKTLNMSMLYYFLSDKEKENAYLFNRLRVTRNQEMMKRQNQYPVIFITLKDMKRGNYKEQVEKFAAIISAEVGKYPELFGSLLLDEYDKEVLMKYRRKESSVSDLQDALLNISNLLQKHYHKKVVILIDEYDVPLQDAYLNHYYNEMTIFLNNVFSAALKTNDSLERGVLTGCLRIAKESIFTGLNNFTVFSIFHEAASRLFGFTQEEMDELLKYYKLEGYRERVKEWYDGYVFGGREIYNPWSVLHYIEKLMISSVKEPESFWANTSGNYIVHDYIRNATPSLREEFDQLTSGGVLEKGILEELTYSEMDDVGNIYSFLLFTGYLKAVKRVDINTCQLAIPNKEIAGIFANVFDKWFQGIVKSAGTALYQALIKEDEIEATKILSNILYHSVSFYDYDEKFYHGVLLGMLSSYDVKSNRESGTGRYDIAVLPPNFYDTALVLEIKVSASLRDLKKDAALAQTQIRSRGCMDGLKQDGYENVIGYGILFYKKTCLDKKVEQQT